MPTRSSFILPALVLLGFCFVVKTAIERSANTQLVIFSDCSQCPEMIILPAGPFRQGDLQGTGDADERPVRSTIFASHFAMARTEVTFAQWDLCVSDGQCSVLLDEDGNPGTKPAHPVQNVSWNDAQDYIVWLSRVSGHRYRLPSESEFEYGARAGTASRFAWGQTPSRQYANYGSDECCGGGASGHDVWEGTAPVRSFPANIFGLFDMAGNVQEWVGDCWHDSYDGAPTDGAAWVSRADCERRVLRGGSWSSTPKMIRPANRDKGMADARLPYYGFRVARDP